MPTQSSVYEAPIRQAFMDFAAHLTESCFLGKEHDCVNRFAHGFLLPQCASSLPDFHPTQIGIEVGVPAPKEVGVKHTVRKDLVIWPSPWMTCFDDTWHGVNHPVVIMEWKAVRKGFRFAGNDHDRAWLTAYTRWQPSILGLSVLAFVGAKPAQRLKIARFVGAAITEDWLLI